MKFLEIICLFWMLHEHNGTFVFFGISQMCNHFNLTDVLFNLINLTLTSFSLSLSLTQKSLTL